jgi:hypothetical protein
VFRPAFLCVLAVRRGFVGGFLPGRLAMAGRCRAMILYRAALTCQAPYYILDQR